MTNDNSARNIANRIVQSADSLAYLAESIGRTSLPEAWRYGPSFEIRLRFQPRLDELDDAELARTLGAMGITGPIRQDRLQVVADRRTVDPADVNSGGLWRPQGYGLWRLTDGAGIGVKVYATSRPAVDLLLAIPPAFIEDFAGCRFGHWSALAGRAEELSGLARLCAAIVRTLLPAQPVARLDAVHLQDQSWCESMRTDDEGIVMPEVVAAACGWTATRSRDGWASIPLDATD